MIKEDSSDVTRRIRAFHQRHGGECYHDGSIHYYADGAVRDVNPLGILAEPPSSDSPEGEHRLEFNKLRFAELKLAVAVRAFDEANDQMRYSVPSDPDADLKRLEALQSEVEKRKLLVNQARESFESTRWARQRSEMRKRHEEAKQQFNEFQERRKAIRI